MKKYDEIEKLKTRKSICLIGHLEPDADALSSMMVFRVFLINKFNIETVDIFAECEFVPVNCEFMMNNTSLNHQHCKQYDTAIMLDCPNLDRLGKYKDLFTEANDTICIDHHSTNQFCAKSNIVEIVSSTSEIIYSIIKQFNYSISPALKECIYAGMITDTNNFTTPNLTNRTFEVVSDIINDIDYIKIYNNFFSNFSITNMQLFASAINNIKTYENGKVICTYICPEKIKELNATFDDYTGIVNRVATTSGNIFTCLIQPDINNNYVSLRAKKGYDVSEIAKKYGGGGHKGASGFISTLSIDEILEIISKDLINELKNTKI